MIAITVLFIILVALTFFCMFLLLGSRRDREAHDRHIALADRRASNLSETIAELNTMILDLMKHVDPWRMQAELMQISGQRIPQAPTLTKHGLMYAALVMEELGETLRAISLPLLELMPDDAMPPKELEPLAITASCLVQSAGELKAYSERIRAELGSVSDDWSVGLTRAEALEIFDGTTDIAVVNSGLALAFGLPGPQGYRAVGVSNLSKRNPDTGVIDKTPDGKWIKGRDYQVPDLGAVLDQFTSADSLPRANG